MLIHIPGLLTPEQTTAMRRRLQAADWADGRETVGAQGAQVKRNEQLAERSPLRQELATEVLQALGRNPLFHAAALPHRILPPRFNRYTGGGTYGDHVDGAVMRLADGTQLRSDIACTLFLDEPERYDGGELIVGDTYGEHEVKLPAGDLIVYPASSIHRVAPVTRGARLAAFFWVQSLIRDDSQRRTLLELDTAIQTLTREDADRGALLQLTAVYHNLLRAWSET
ncbi:Fe2+-dependent dioxygenase [Oleiagrimonas soli]|uniref:Fe(II)-dependent oxygenase n=1 Tax=Oleiagrimonas soli TaxID=1543381 RepID=A0A099CUY8_9GAMM|nr:Fe2+-dependent dioxygenase [Oleiagrimonas soli]KGI77768.1 Fe(II)-dependent oxygenase [Oleiagrimonas soli]MBB6183910.1 PKHD-type hydroxylase [Oleiagrimonas soli]